MIEFGWIKTSFLLIPVLQITAPGTGRHPPSFTVKDGDEVTLPCGNVIKHKHNCDRATWLFSDSENTAAVELFEHGQIGENAKAKSDRLSVTENCSLVIKEVTAEDVGRYICQQYKLGQPQGHGSQVNLSVVTMTEHEDTDKVTLNCSVTTRGRCRHTVKWLFEGKDVDKDNKDLKTSQSTCSANVTFKTSFIYTSKNYELLKCEVTDGNRRKVHLSPQPEENKRGEDTKAATTKSTTITAMEKSATVGTESANNDTAKKSQDWWWYILVAVGLAALLITVVAVLGWRRTKANNTRMDDNIADPEDGVSYASISYTKKTSSKARVWGKDDEGEAVIYSTVKASSSSAAGASADPSDLYATINKP